MGWCDYKQSTVTLRLDYIDISQGLSGDLKNEDGECKDCCLRVCPPLLYTTH